MIPRAYYFKPQIIRTSRSGDVSRKPMTSKTIRIVGTTKVGAIIVSDANSKINSRTEKTATNPTMTMTIRTTTSNSAPIVANVAKAGSNRVLKMTSRFRTDVVDVAAAMLT